MTSEAREDVLVAAGLTTRTARTPRAYDRGARIAPSARWVGSLTVTDQPRDPAGPTSGAGATALALAVLVAAVEAFALLAYAVLIAVIALQGATEGSAPAVETVVYAVLAAGIGLVARGLHARRHLAYGPFIVTQLFALVVGGTVIAGGSLLTGVIGAAVLLVALIGLALAANRDLRAALVD